MKTALFAASMVLILGAPLRNATCGGLEKYFRAAVGGCPQNSQLVTERWAATAMPVQWEIRTSSSPCSDTPHVFILPGLRNPTNPASIEEIPGYESLKRAAAKWSSLGAPTSPCYLVEPSGTASYFRFEAEPEITPGAMPPMIWNVDPQNPVVPTGTSINDSANTVTCFAPPAFFGPFGGVGVLAVTPVRYSSCQQFGNFVGEIVEADILFNARSLQFSFIEQDPTSGLTYASYGEGPVGSFAPPLNGYVDFEGVATHEFGHVLGLGHSVIDADSAPGNSYFPTMFPYAQAEPFSASAITYEAVPGTNQCQLTHSIVAVDAATTPEGGLLGRSAASLELDDIAAVIAGYPLQPGAGALGSIVGTITDPSGNGISGLSVCAVSTACSGVGRAACLTEDPPGSSGPGSFVLAGLPPGEYRLYVEQVDSVGQPNGGLLDFSAPPDEYFNLGALPSILWPIGFGFAGTFGCPGWTCNFQDEGGGNPAEIYVEYFSSDELTGDPHTQTSTTLTVVAGQSTTANMTVSIPRVPGTPIQLSLSIRPVGSSNFSMRGVKTPATAPTSPPSPVQVELLVNARPGIDSGKLISIYRSTGTSYTMYGSQLAQFMLIPANLVNFGVINANGQYRYTYTVQQQDAFWNLKFQAALAQWPLPNSPFILEEASNPVNLWVTRP